MFEFKWLKYKPEDFAKPVSVRDLTNEEVLNLYENDNDYLTEDTCGREYTFEAGVRSIGLFDNEEDREELTEAGLDAAAKSAKWKLKRRQEKEIKRAQEAVQAASSWNVSSKVLPTPSFPDPGQTLEQGAEQ